MCRASYAGASGFAVLGFFVIACLAVISYIFLLFAIILRYGILLTINGHRQMSATLPIKMSLAYGMIPLSALCFIYYGTLNIVKVIKNDILIKIKAGK